MPLPLKPPPGVQILVVDDDEVIRYALSRQLQERGFAVTAVASGAAALETLARRPFDLVLLDIVMPGMEGTEVLKRIRMTYRPEELPVIMASARDNEDEIVRALELGANDFVPKPTPDAILLARIGTQARFKRANDELKNAYRRIKDDLDQAAQVQRSFLPAEALEDGRADFAWAFHPCDEVGGDILNLYRLDEDRVALYLLDVSGHGVTAALKSAALAHVLAPAFGAGFSAALGGTRPPLPAQPPSPSDLASRLNRRLPLDRHTCQYFTLFYGVFNLERRTLRYIAAGHPGPVVVRAADGSASACAVTGPGIGIVPGAEFPEATLPLAPGDRVYLFSDGILEARNPAGEEFGMERCVEELSGPADPDVTNSLDRLVNAAQAWSSGRQADDISALAFALAGDDDGAG